MKKNMKRTAIISVLTIVYVIFIHIFVDRGKHLSPVYLLLHFTGVLPCGLSSFFIIEYIDEKVWAWHIRKCGEHPFLFALVFLLLVILFGAGRRGAGIVHLFILIFFGFAPTMIGIVLGNLILGNGLTTVI